METAAENIEVQADEISHGGGCGCSGCSTEGAGHNRSMARLRTAIIGGALIVNSYLLRWLFPEQIFAAELRTALRWALAT